MADWQIALIIGGVLFVAWAFFGCSGRYVIWRYPIVYMETSWMNLAEHMRQVYRRGVETWLLFRHNTGPEVRAFKFVVLNDPVIYFFIVVNWVKRDSPDYDRYAEALEECGATMWDKASVYSEHKANRGTNVEDYEKTKWDIFNPERRIKSLEPYMDRLVCRCDDWDVATVVARRAFELAGLESPDAKYFVWMRDAAHTDDVLLDGTVKGRDKKTGYKEQPYDSAKRRKPPRYDRAKEMWNLGTYIRVWLRDMVLECSHPVRGFRKHADPDAMPDPRCFEAAMEHKDVLTGRERRLEHYMKPGRYAGVYRWKRKQKPADKDSP